MQEERGLMCLMQYMILTQYLGKRDPLVRNLGMLRKAVTVIDSLSSKPEFIYLQYGNCLYGASFTNDFYMPVSLSESLPLLRKLFLDFVPHPILLRQFSGVSHSNGA